MTVANELRFAFVIQDFDAGLRLFRDVLGLDSLMSFEHQGGHGVVLKVASATLELFDPTYGRYVDQVEVGHPLDERVRIAVQVDDLEEATEAVLSTGASRIADPVQTPWGDHNLRLRTSDGLQLTLFESPRNDP
jgi:lactoylglutathione lyase